MAKRHETAIAPAFPRAHLLLASAIAVATALPLIFWPSEDVSAQDPVENANQQLVISLSTPVLLPMAPAKSQPVLTKVQKPSSTSLKPGIESANRPTQDKPATPAPAAAIQPAQTPDAAHAAAADQRHFMDGDWQTTTIQRGDNLSLALARLGLGSRDVHELVNADKLGKQFRRLRPGETIAVQVTDDGKLARLSYRRNRLESIRVTREDGNLKYEYLKREPEVLTTHAVGEIRNSLFVDGSAAGLSDNMVMKLAELFGWDIDFALDIREGDQFSLMYEERFIDGQKIGDGNILAARFVNQGQTYTALRFEDSKGNSGYYSPDGNSVRKAFIRSPVPLARISSRFNLSRKHPVLHTVRAHKGVDYAASRGTPIKATGDGKVIHAARKGGYGRAVIIQHGETYSTLYAHLNGYARGIRKGARVKQGQVIGYIGSSGLATGPHLHYEFRVNGVHRNPLTVRFPAADPVPAAERGRFAAIKETLLSKLDKLTSGEEQQLALNQ